MAPRTARVLEIAGTELIGLMLIRAFLSEVAPGRVWDESMSRPETSQMLEKVKVLFDADDRARLTVFTVLGRQSVAGLALAIGDESAEVLNRWLDQRLEAMGTYEAHPSELTGARIVRALVPELSGEPGGVEDVAAGVAEAAGTAEDLHEVLVSLALFAANMFLSAFRSLDQALKAIDAQAAPLLPAPVFPASSPN